jgi:hypothetical protein
MARNNAKIALYFTVSQNPTAAELVEIGALERTYAQVKVLRGDVPVGLPASRLMPGDAIAGTPPQAYIDAVGSYADGQLTVGADDKPEALLILPGTATMAAAGGTLQLRLCMAQLNMTTNVVTLTDITQQANTAWSSGTPAKGTVNASTGLVTGANGGAGTSVITATVTYDTNKTMLATRTATFT